MGLAISLVAANQEKVRKSGVRLHIAIIVFLGLVSHLPKQGKEVFECKADR